MEGATVARRLVVRRGDVTGAARRKANLSRRERRTSIEEKIAEWSNRIDGKGDGYREVEITAANWTNSARGEIFFPATTIATASLSARRLQDVPGEMREYL